MIRPVCQRCGSRFIASTLNPGPGHLARHARSLPCAALTWLRRHPATPIRATDLLAALDAEGWKPNGKQPSKAHATTVLGTLVHLGYVRRVTPGVFAYAAQRETLTP